MAYEGMIAETIRIVGHNGDRFRPMSRGRWAPARSPAWC